jgi:hypothetical protein
VACIGADSGYDSALMMVPGFEKLFGTRVKRERGQAQMG